jgi:two-component system C4-dicarboxylate transport response regulator DctD
MAAEEPATLVLLVEDDPDVREVLRQTLEEAGHVVETVSSRAEAAPRLLSGDVGLLITDMVLADGDGSALMRIAERHAIPVVGITGHPIRPRPLRPVPTPRRVLLQKPFPPEDLRRQANRLLAHALEA